MPDYCPNQHLLGVAGSRHALATPSLILDLDALEHNIAAMAAQSTRLGIDLRPHAKTHKCSRIARMQVEAGAVGICTATLRETLVFADTGIEHIHISTPLVNEIYLRELRGLCERHGGVSMVVDSLVGLQALEKQFAGTSQLVRVFVDVDFGAMYRTGVATLDSALALARAIDDSPALTFGGLQNYSGIVQHIPEAAARAAFYGRQLTELQELIDRLNGIGMTPPVVTGGGTGTFAIDGQSGVITENQAGSYVFLDVEYGDIEFLENQANPFQPALFVQSTVLSNNATGMVTIDAGTKSLATDGPTPRIARGAPAGSVYQNFGDEFGAVIFPDSMDEARLRQPPTADTPLYQQFYELFGNMRETSDHLEVGAKVELLAPHCDPTVNLFHTYHCVRGDTLVDIWPIDARGNL